MADINSVRFGEQMFEGWVHLLDGDTTECWFNTAHNPTASCIKQFNPFRFSQLSDLSDDAKVRDEIRNFYNLSGAGLVSCDVITLSDVRMVKTIEKRPQEPQGM